MDHAIASDQNTAPIREEEPVLEMPVRVAPPKTDPRRVTPLSTTPGVGRERERRRGPFPTTVHGTVRADGGKQPGRQGGERSGATRTVRAMTGDALNPRVQDRGAPAPRPMATHATQPAKFTTLATRRHYFW